ncbi:winged helix-turn-helix domain-containing protein [Kitasatospora sp. SUK 42]|uniref:winged helix-turn-helix domain-containing protein n=1 Tax=Kitasatospora sp. SUK 42 TaxID=1588882 RepID=UPI0018CB1F30|nr:winged helix-turn-helix domain-containing protein [Kitasatospora sp. SUK 42]MBV2156251.1 winged helix-turn-helix domain-containing protein [Kitasatospora sp. SUK 42]
MSSSSTATLPLPTATPHLRAVRSVPSVPPVPVVPTIPSVPSVAGASRPVTGPSRPVAGPAVAPQPGAVVPPAPQSLLAALPEGATVVAALPQGALPQGLLAQYGAQSGAQPGGAAGHPMIGYLVLVPAESPAAPSVVPNAPGTGAPGAVRPVRPAGRGITVDTERRNAYVDGRLLDLTYLEFELLAHLTEHPQRVHTRDHLVSAVWGYGHVGDGRTVDVHVARLRRKLGPAYRGTIVTVRRVGYKYTPVS